MFIKHVLIYSAHVQMVTTPWPRPPAARCQRASRHREFPLIPNRRPSSAPSSSRTNNSRSKNKRSYFTPSFSLFISSSLFSLFKVFFLLSFLLLSFSCLLLLHCSPLYLLKSLFYRCTNNIWTISRSSCSKQS